MSAITAKDLTSEFIGTYLLVLTVGCNTVSTASGTWAALSIASVLMVSVYALGSVSGAAFNPAVTLAVFLEKDSGMPANKMAAYMVTQLIAGCLAGMSSYMVHGEAMQLEPGAGYSYGGVAVAEILYTFMLCFTVLRVAVAKGVTPNEHYGLAIGFVIVAGGYGAGFISKGAFNPAVALGVDVGSAGQGVYWSMFYFVFEFIGAALAAVVSNFLGEAAGPFSLGQKCVAEFIGTFFLILTVGFNVLGGSPAPALSIAASLMCMIYALGHVSGANFNPAVTFALLLDGAESKMDASTAGAYVAAQLAGGITAALTYSFTVGSAVPLAPGAGHSWATCAFAEIIFTFVLCFVVLNVAVNAEGKLKEFYGLAIGFVITAGGYAIGAVSGGSLNPAVSVALDTSNMVKLGGSFGNCAMYTLFELVGAGMAYGAYKVCRPDTKAGFLGKVEKPTYGTA